MKVGDNKPIPPGAAKDPAHPATPTPEARGGFTERVEGPEAPNAPEGAAGAQGPEAPGWTDPADESDLQAVAARVDRGDLSAEEAVKLVVDHVLDAQLPADATAEVRERVRSLVEASLETDPMLRSLIQRLGGGS